MAEKTGHHGDLPHKMTLSDFMVQARETGTLATQSGLMDGEPACVVAAHGKNAERLMRYIRRAFIAQGQETLQ